MKPETRSDSPRTASPVLKGIDLFAGIGGIRKGFQEAFGDDFEVVFSSEIDKYAIKTYSANFNDTSVAGDITKIDERHIPSFDICLAGFPCQAFSVGGKKLGFEDTRGTLFHEVVRLCKYHKPKVIFCENVDNLLRHDSGRTFKVIVGALEENAVSSKYYISETYFNWLKRHKENHKAKGNGFGYKILDLDGICSTLTASNSSVEHCLVIDPRQTDFSNTEGLKGDGKYNSEFIRRLTPREMARLQGFPDDFIIPVSNTRAYKQFGNSVTVPVIEAIAKQIKATLNK